MALHKTENQVLIIAMVSVVAMLAIVAGHTAVTGGATHSPVDIVCEDDTYCLEWEWLNEPSLVCGQYEMQENKLCVEYATENGELVCSGWETEFDDQCVEWKLEDSWERVCMEERTKPDCYVAE